MSGALGLSPISLYVNDAAHEPALAAAAVKSDPQSAALIAYFKTVAPTLTTPDKLLKNYKALSLVLGAFNLFGAINNTAILRKLLTQDPTAKGSLAQTLGNTKYQLLANGLSNWRTPPFASTAAISQIVSAYATNTFETKAGAQVPGLANALYFTREASSLKSVAAVQSDTNLLSVVVTGLGLPLQNFEELDFNQQSAILKNKFHPADLQRPAYVKQVAEQYIISQQSASDAAPAPGSTAALFSDGSDDSGDTLLSILNPGSDAAGGTASGVVSLFA